MKKWIVIILVLVSAYSETFAEDVVTLTPDMFVMYQEIQLANLEGWYFKQGSDSAGVQDPSIDPDWIKMKLIELRPGLADENGRLEGWFTIRFTVSRDFDSIPLRLKSNAWAAMDIYLDNTLFRQLGNTGEPYNEYNPIKKHAFDIDLKPGKIHTLTFHFVDYISTFPTKRLRLLFSDKYNYLNITGPKYNQRIEEEIKYGPIFSTIITSSTAITAFLFWMIYFVSRAKENLFIISITVTIIFIISLAEYITRHPVFSHAFQLRNEMIISILSSILDFLLPIVIARIFRVKWTTPLKIVMSILFVLLAVGIFKSAYGIYSQGILLGINFYFVISSWRSLYGAQWAVVAGLVSYTVLSLSFIGVVIFGSLGDLGPFYILSFLTVIYVIAPFSLLVYIILRFREINDEVKHHADEVIKITEERKQILENQNEKLEEQVNERTSELKTSLENLKATQSQLIQSEKMASLGELTAGIAHEIQNPLNFVNNFSEVNRELIEELKEAVASNDQEEIQEILKDLAENEDKVKHHGQRAEGIVKGMLQHSRTSQGEKEPTDVNALADEYLRLAYHGLRAKDNSFNADFETEFDPALPKVNVIPQDIGRVLLNLINNAFYAVDKKAKEGIDGYQPLVEISTKNNSKSIEISVKDNGPGIPEENKDKIFQPFFTTKPTGSGTGLGLSLSYDIVKAHGGELKVESKKNLSTEFIIIIPI